MAATNKFGEILDLTKDSIQKARRGAVATFEHDLLDLLRGITATSARAVTFYVVDRAHYPATDEGETAWKNERQRIGAILRSHAHEAGLGKISINWEPNKHYPQVSLKGS
tara:strand:+ start:82 stop:411 length:330 start_codon:yes stop_codon:yes gene_type:complete